jgi:hypothetical protein
VLPRLVSLAPPLPPLSESLLPLLRILIDSSPPCAYSRVYPLCSCQRGSKENPPVLSFLRAAACRRQAVRFLPTGRRKLRQLRAGWLPSLPSSLIPPVYADSLIGVLSYHPPNCLEDFGAISANS